MKKINENIALLKAVAKELEYFYCQYPCESSPVLLKSVKDKIFTLEKEEKGRLNENIV